MSNRALEVLTLVESEDLSADPALVRRVATGVSGFVDSADAAKSLAPSTGDDNAGDESAAVDSR